MVFVQRAGVVPPGGAGDASDGQMVPIQADGLARRVGCSALRGRIGQAVKHFQEAHQSLRGPPLT